VRKARLLSTVAFALLFGAGAASAQGMSKDTPERAPAAQQNAPAEKVAPSMKNGEHKAPQTTGQATPDAKSGDAKSGDAKSGDVKSGKAKETTGQATSDKLDKSDKAKETTGQSPKSEKSEKSDMGQRGPGGAPQESSPQNGGMNNKSSTDNNPSASPSNRSSTEQNRTTTGQGAGGAAKLTTEQRTKISTVIRSQKVERVNNLNVSISVGTRIPTSVHVHALPQEVIVIYPEWRGYDYILVGEQIVIISPRTHEIVAVIDA
jgi:Protein of unknown function (DUF1236)